jgi:hypothetical protein
LRWFEVVYDDTVVRFPATERMGVWKPTKSVLVKDETGTWREATKRERRRYSIDREIRRLRELHSWALEFEATVPSSRSWTTLNRKFHLHALRTRRGLQRVIDPEAVARRLQASDDLAAVAEELHVTRQSIYNRRSRDRR